MSLVHVGIRQRRVNETLASFQGLIHQGKATSHVVTFWISLTMPRLETETVRQYDIYGSYSTTLYLTVTFLLGYQAFEA